MKRSVYNLSLVFSVFMLSAVAEAQSRIEQKLPFPRLNVEFVEKTGTASTGDVLKGKVSVVFFWASWCNICKERIPELQQIQATFPADQVQVVFVNVDEDRAKAVKYMTENPTLIPSSLYDVGMKMRNEGPVIALPFTVLLDDKMTVNYIHVGARATVLDILIRKIERLNQRALTHRSAKS